MLSKLQNIKQSLRTLRFDDYDDDSTISNLSTALPETCDTQTDENSEMYYIDIPFQHDLVNGYYRLNFSRYLSKEIHMLSMLYLCIEEEFQLCDTNISQNHYLISSINNICTKISSDGKYGVFGKNIINASNNKNDNYYHWQFKILSNIQNSMQKQGIIVGIVQNDTENLRNWTNIATDRNTYLFYGLKAVKQNRYTVDKYGIKWNQQYDILDMYLDLNKGDLTFTINNKLFGTAFANINTNLKYCMAMSLPYKYCVELIAYDHSKFHAESINSNNVLGLMGYARSIICIEQKWKYLKKALSICPNMSILHNDCIDCLVLKKEKWQNIYDCIIKHNHIIDINFIHNILNICDTAMKGRQFITIDLYSMIEHENEINSDNIETIADYYENTNNYNKGGG
eukprot:350380_1